MLTTEDILNNIGEDIINIIPEGEIFDLAFLEITKFVASVQYTGYYMQDNAKHWLKVGNLNTSVQAIQELHFLTQNKFPIHKNWNKVNYTLYPEGRFRVEYIWDQELQDKIDRYQKEYIKK